MTILSKPLTLAIFLASAFTLGSVAWAGLEVKDLPSGDPYGPASQATSYRFPRALLELAETASNVSADDFQNDDFFWTRTVSMRANLVAQAKRMALTKLIQSDPVAALGKLDALAIASVSSTAPITASEYLDALFYIKHFAAQNSPRLAQNKLIEKFFLAPDAFLSLRPSPGEIQRLQKERFIAEELRDAYSRADWETGNYDRPMIYAGLYFNFLMEVLGRKDSLPADELFDILLDAESPYSLVALNKIPIDGPIENYRGTIALSSSPSHIVQTSGIKFYLDTSNTKDLFPRLLKTLTARQVNVQQLDRLMLFLIRHFTDPTSNKYHFGADKDLISKLESEIIALQQSRLETRQDPAVYSRFLSLIRSPGPQSIAKIGQYLPLETNPVERATIVQTLGEMLSNFETQDRTVRNISLYCKSIHCTALEFTEVIRTLRKKHPQWIEHRTPTFERIGLEFVHTVEDYVALGLLRWDAIAPYEEIARWIDNGMAYVKSPMDYVTLMRKTPESASVLEGDIDRFFALQPNSSEIEILLSDLPENSPLRSRLIQQHFPIMAETLQSAQSYFSWARLSLSAPNPNGHAMAENAVRRSLSHFFELRPSLQQVNAFATAVSTNPQLADLVPQIHKRAIELLIPNGIRSQGSTGIDLSDPAASARHYAQLVRSLLGTKSLKAPDTEELVVASLPTFFQLKPDMIHINAVLTAQLSPAHRESVRLAAIRQAQSRKALSALKVPFWFNQSAELKRALKVARLRIDNTCANALLRE